MSDESEQKLTTLTAIKDRIVTAYVKDDGWVVIEQMVRRHGEMMTNEVRISPDEFEQLKSMTEGHWAHDPNRERG